MTPAAASHQPGCHPHTAETLGHQALFYRDADEYVQGVSRFIRPGLDAGEPVAIAVPADRARLLREGLADDAPTVEVLDMVELGRNPARIIPAVHGMLEKHGGRMLHYVGEPIWPGRSPEEIREATRHEALINLAWPGAEIRVLCPYDARSLDDGVLADAERTHPWLIREGRSAASPAYSGPAVPPVCEQPLTPPPPEALSMDFGLDDLGQVRSFVGASAGGAGIPAERVHDLILAVNEVATNTIKYAGSVGRFTTWFVSGQMLCQIEDAGHIADPLAGRHLPAPGGVEGGLGLWMVNQLCDLVQVRSSEAGTTIRLHTRLD